MMNLGQFEQTYDVSFRIEDTDGNPLRRARVDIEFPTTAISGDTDFNGVVQFTVDQSRAPTGFAKVAVYKEGYSWRPPRSVDLRKPITHLITLREDPSTVPATDLAPPAKTNWGQMAIWGGVGLAALLVIPKLFGR